MELRLENGKYVPRGATGLERVQGEDELLQRICMKLKARRGGFYPMPEYGSRLYSLTSVKPSMRETAARQYILEALSDEQGLALDTVTVSAENEELCVSAEFTYQGDVKLTVDTWI